MADYYVREEDGTSKYILEDSSGDYLLEAQSTVSPTFIASVTVVYAAATSPAEARPSFIASATAVHAPTVTYAGAGLFTTPGTFSWVCPAGLTEVDVEAFGGGGGGGNQTALQGGGGGGGGAYAARGSIPVTPGTVYTFVVGAGGAAISDGASSTFTGDSGVQVVAGGGSHGLTGSTHGAGGAAASCTGDFARSGGNGGDGVSGTAFAGGGGASGNISAAGADGSQPTGGVGANGGGSGGSGSDANLDGNPGVSPGGGGGGAGASNTAHSGGAGAGGLVRITPHIFAPFIASATVVYTPALPIQAPFISSATVVYAPGLPTQIAAPFIASVTVVYTPDLPEVHAPFIGSVTRVYRAFSLFDPNRTFSGPGNGGETFLIRLAPNGTTETATLAANISGTDTALELTGDGSFPSTEPFVVTIDSEVIYLVQVAAGSYRIRGRGMSNTTAAAHTAGATVAWGDTYDQAIAAADNIDHDFTADINSTGSFTYPGWLVCFDATQAYLSGSRYPIHVTELVGVFDAGAGSSGTNRLDASQPDAISTATGTSDDCPAALSNPARIQTNIAAGDVAVVRYTNPEATALDLGPRSTALQSWFGLKRVSTSDADVTFTGPNGIVVDTTGTYDTFTGSINGEFHNPSAIGIGPDTGIPTPNPVPWTSVTLPGTDRFFTRGSGSGGYDEKGWPFGVLAVRQGNRRVPLWRSFDWHNFSYVFSGFDTDCTFAQIVVNRNGVASTEPEVVLPGPQDIDGPDAVWDDGTYYFGVSWYVAIFNGPYLVIGPPIGGTVPTDGGGTPTPPSYVPGVSFPPGPPVVTLPTPPPLEGGSGGDIVPSAGQLLQIAAV